MVALGAERGRIARSVLREAITYAVAGLLVGIPAALAASGLLGALVFGVSPTDPLTYAAIAALTIATAILASLLPALRASRVDPVSALKS